MIDLQLWTERLQDQVIELDGRAYDAAEAWRTAEAPPATPVCYVGPYRDTKMGDRDEPSRYVTEIEALVSVLVVLPENVDPLTRVADLGDLQSVRKSIASALIRWQPEDCIRPIVYHEGSMVQWVNGKTQWADRYMTRYLLLAGMEPDFPNLVRITTVDTGPVAGNRGEIIKAPDGTITTEEFSDDE